MTETPINLNKARKERVRKARKSQADANAVKHGRSKSVKQLDAARGKQDKDRLDQHKRDNS